jgi:hypothetical protein
VLTLDFNKAREFCCCYRMNAVLDRELWLRIEQDPPPNRPDNWKPRTQSVCCLSEGTWDSIDVLAACAELSDIQPAPIWRPKHFEPWDGLDEDTIVRVFAIEGVAPYYRRPKRPTRFRSWPLYNLLSGRPIGRHQGRTFKVVNALVHVGLARVHSTWTGNWHGREAYLVWSSAAQRPSEQQLASEEESALAKFV